MIICDMDGWEEEKSAYHPAIQRAVRYLQQTDLLQHPLGEVDIEGRDMYASFMEQDAVLPTERKAEQHRKYLDVHLFIEGKEDEIIVASRHSEKNKPVAVRFEEKDCALYEQVQGEFEIKLRPGMLAIFFPDDLHRPCCTVSGQGRLRKVVVKINKALLEMI